jgi:agmatine/peptidylarginine deiminase
VRHGNFAYLTSLHVLYVPCHDTTADKDYVKAVTRNREALEKATDAHGRHFTIINLPECEEVLESPLAIRTHGEFCNSYVNFYLTNEGGLVAPSFGYASDTVARDILQEAFPGREVVMVDISGVACGGGGIHCITQQQPATRSSTTVQLSSPTTKHVCVVDDDDDDDDDGGSII